jgi:hypothetical protein
VIDTHRPGIGEVIEHHRRWETAQHVRELNDLTAFDIELNMPAEIGDAFRQRSTMPGVRPQSRDRQG